MSVVDKIYNGESESFSSLVGGYVDYSNEVILKRSIAELRDGLKPVNRRILYSMFKNNIKGTLVKSPEPVSDALKLHPHGDQAVYSAMCLMTDENEGNNIAYIHALGNLGKVYSSMPPAAMRYTKVVLNDYAYSDLWKDSEVMKMIPSEEGNGTEPEVFNTLYPVVLVNGSNGIAVGAASKMASFNLIDVLELTKKYVQKKKLTIDDMIIPDFPSGGVLVCNRESIAKIMLTGFGKIKVRAKVEIDGSMIYVKEVPVGKTAEGIEKAIKLADLPDVKDVVASIGRDSQGHVIIYCKNKRVVEDVLMQLYQRNILQNTFSSNMLLVDNGEPVILGVYEIIERWYNYRCEVLAKKFDLMLESLKPEKHQLLSLMRLINDDEKKDEFINLAIHEGRKPAVQYLVDNIGGMLESEAGWIYERGLNVFHRGGTYAKRLEDLKSMEIDIQHNRNNIDEYIIGELDGLLSARRNLPEFQRKSEISYTEYRFSRIVDTTEIEDDSPCVYSFLKTGFLIKSRSEVSNKDLLCNIKAYANSVLIGFDNYGRVLRVVGKEIPFSSGDGIGTYLPKYFGVEDEVEQEFDYKILYMCLLDGSKKTLVYRDGYIGYFDTSEFVGKKNTRIISHGVCTAVRDKLLHIFEEDEVPEVLLLAGEEEDYVKFGVVRLGGVIEKSRTSRTKVLSGNSINSTYLKGFNSFDIYRYIEDPDAYDGRYKKFKGTLYGDSEELYEGFYLDMCKDINN